ncbi:hypothetical protein QVD17_30290 [Tagetes erecta]|uniref:Uncharacterized protein n=1 Tax=Tagetes erecta TaxID=13708 RepID=A0AAD8NM45_TARER|nr:hypothetical protein QVD17_30290 [Tagetes erecta]
MNTPVFLVLPGPKQVHQVAKWEHKFEASCWGEFAKTLTDVESILYPYVQAVSRCHGQPLSVLKDLEPVGLNKDIVGKSLEFPTLKRSITQATGEEAGPSRSAKKVKILVKAKPAEHKPDAEDVIKPAADLCSDPDVHTFYDDVSNLTIDGRPTASSGNLPDLP